MFCIPALLLGLWGCSGRDWEDDEEETGYENPAVPGERIPAATDAFTEYYCPDQDATGYVSQCGTVTVPVSPDSDETIDIVMTRVFTDDPNPQPDPVIYLDGGPGAASLVNVPYLFETFHTMFPDRDLIFFDQRGVGQTTPDLSCTSTGDTFDVLDRCYQRLNNEVDLNAYRTVNNAHDVGALVRALGYEQVNLFAISYGTRLALTVMREHPEIVRSSIIDSVVPLQVDLFAETGLNGYNALVALFEACAADAVCHAKYPDTKGQLVSVVEDLNAAPLEIYGYPVDGNAVVSVIFQMMYSASLLPYIPLLVDAIALGDTTVLEAMFGYATQDSGFSFGMHLSLQCAEEVSFSSPQAFEARDALIDPTFRDALSASIYLDYCQHWPVDAAPAIENQPVQSDLPTLVLAGHFDPITPPVFAMAAHDHLSNGQYFQLGAESHGASVSACGASLVDAFIHAPTEKVAGSCALAPADLEFQNRNGTPSREVGGKVKWQLEKPSERAMEEAISQARLRRRMIVR
jgi:pimeloyl-ACP methyl ester carboxylesterase